MGHVSSHSLLHATEVKSRPTFWDIIFDLEFRMEGMGRYTWTFVSRLHSLYLHDFFKALFFLGKFESLTLTYKYIFISNLHDRQSNTERKKLQIEWYFLESLDQSHELSLLSCLRQRPKHISEPFCFCSLQDKGTFGRWQYWASWQQMSKNENSALNLTEAILLATRTELVSNERAKWLTR